MSTSLSITDQVTPFLHRLGALTPAGRQVLNTAVAGEVTDLVRAYLRAWSRHDTAERLGGTPTQFMRHAADATDAVADADRAETVIQSPGFNRADHPVDIYPTAGHTYLTLPIAGESYGHRIREFPGGHFLRGKGAQGTASLVYGIGEGAGFHPLYALVTHVHQEQDRTLLPSDEAIMKAALTGADAGIHDLMEQSTTVTE